MASTLKDYPQAMRQVPPGLARALHEGGRAVHLAFGQELLVSKRPIDAAYLVLEGAVSVTLGYRSAYSEIAQAQPGQWVVDPGVLVDEALASISAFAVKPSVVLAVHRNWIYETLERAPATGGEMIAILRAALGQALQLAHAQEAAPLRLVRNAQAADASDVLEDGAVQDRTLRTFMTHLFRR